ncbi:MAG TPA: T9SS type A sorting domain-containing protein [Parafilimonas sp.]|nr:T9SS type A sorting domain-containing protein [Parafilimonas sp.]
MKTTLLLIAFATIYSTSSFSQAGTLDSSFGKNGKIKKILGAGSAIAVQSNGKIVVTSNSFLSGFSVVRYDQSGHIDHNFGVDGIVRAFSNGRATSVIVKPSGKIYAAGYANENFAVAKFNHDGTPDNSFGNNGEVSTNFLGDFDDAFALLVQPDSKIIAAGVAYEPNGNDESRVALARYNTDGSLDSSFNFTGKVAKHVSVNGFDYCTSAALQPDGKIIAAGYSHNTTTNDDYMLVRFKPNGKIDSSFGTNGVTFTDFGGYDDANGVALQSDGKIVVVGYTHDQDFISKIVIARYSDKGILDKTFGTNGSVILDFNTNYATGNAVTIQSDDKILIAAFVAYNENFTVLRFNKDGSRDNTFGKNGRAAFDVGTNSNANALALQPDNKIVVTGEANNDIVVVRLNNDASTGNIIVDNSSLASIKDISLNIQIFPNPVKDVLHVSGLTSAQTTISIFNVEGKLMQRSVAVNRTTDLNIAQLPAGTYYLHVEENVAAKPNNKKISNIKFVKGIKILCYKTWFSACTYLFWNEDGAMRKNVFLTNKVLNTQ